MTNNIGTVPIGSIQEISVVNGSENDEIDLVDKNSNIVFVGNDEGVDVSIECVLTKTVHPQSLEVEEQRDDVKSLMSRQSLDNDFVFNDRRGWLVAESVSVPESSDMRNVREAQIEGKFLPWPKHESEEAPPKNYEFPVSDVVTVSLQWVGEIDLSAIFGLSSAGSFGNVFGLEFNRDWKDWSTNIFIEGDLEIE